MVSFLHSTVLVLRNDFSKIRQSGSVGTPDIFLFFFTFFPFLKLQTNFVHIISLSSFTTAHMHCTIINSKYDLTLDHDVWDFMIFLSFEWMIEKKYWVLPLVGFTLIFFFNHPLVMKNIFGSYLKFMIVNHAWLSKSIEKYHLWLWYHSKILNLSLVAFGHSW